MADFTRRDRWLWPSLAVMGLGAAIVNLMPGNGWFPYAVGFGLFVVGVVIYIRSPRWEK